YRPSSVVQRRFVRFALGAIAATVGLLAPEAFYGSLAALNHNVFARTQEGLAMGGLSLSGVRYFRTWSWLLIWGFQNSATVFYLSSAAQLLAIIGWAGWTVAMVRRSSAFGLLVGTVGTLASFTILSPVSNPQYILWWVPAL